MLLPFESRPGMSASRCVFRSALLGLLLCSLAVSAARASVGVVVADTHVISTLPSTNFGTRANLAVNPNSTALLQFSMAGLPAGTTSAQITSAMLYVYVNRMNTAGSLSLTPLTSGFSELSATYATMPTAGTPTGSLTVSAAGAFVAVDVTALVQGWITTPASNFGVSLSSTAADVLLDSKENDLTGHAAFVDITLAGATGPQGPAGPAGPQGPAGLTGAQGAAGYSPSQQVATSVVPPVVTYLSSPTGCTNCSFTNPTLVVFNGTNIYVATNSSATNPTSSKIIVMSTSGAYIKSYTPTHTSYSFVVTDMKSDGTDVWVSGQGCIEKLASGNSYCNGGFPQGINSAPGLAFDGTYMWANFGTTSPAAFDSTVTKQKTGPSCSNSIGFIGLGFDGVNLFSGCGTDLMYWNTAGQTVNANISPYPPTYQGPSQGGGSGGCFGGGSSSSLFGKLSSASDGQHVWAVCTVLAPYTLSALQNVSFQDAFQELIPGVSSVSVIASSNPVGKNITGITYPGGIAFDGRFLWVTNGTGNTVVEFDPLTATPVRTIALYNQTATTVPTTYPLGIAFDGKNMWVANYGANNVVVIPN